MNLFSRQSSSQDVLQHVMQKVSRVLNERVAQDEGEAAALERTGSADFDPQDEDLLLGLQDNILLRRDSRPLGDNPLCR